jgi:hypothetical protein
MTIEIRETTIATDGDASIVSLHIADVPLSESAAAFRLNLAVRLPRYRAPFLFQVQREAILQAATALHEIAESLLQDLPPGARPRPARETD